MEAAFELEEAKTHILLDDVQHVALGQTDPSEVRRSVVSQADVMAPMGR